MNEFKPLNFTPAPPQQQASDLMALLQAMGGLGLNIAGAATKTGAVGNQLNQQSMQTQAQATENQREQNKMQGLEKQSKALWNQAQSMGMPLPQLATVQADLENRDINNAQQNIRWFESALREKKQDARTAVQEAKFALQAAEADAAQDPNVRIARGMDAIKGLKEVTRSNIETLIGGVEGLVKGEKDKKQLAQNIYDALQNPRELYNPSTWISPGQQSATDVLQSRPELAAGLQKAQSISQYRKLLSGLSSVDPKKQAAAYAQFQQLQSGVAPVPPPASEPIRVQNLKTGQVGTLPAAEFDPTIYKKL